MKSGADGIQLTPPAAIMPMPVITAAVEPALWSITFDQSVFATRTAQDQHREDAEEIRRVRVAPCTAVMPSPEIAKVATTNAGSVTMSSTLFALMPNRMSRMVSIAYAPVTALIVSQPQRAIQISEPGSGLPRCLKTARDSAMPGAAPPTAAMPIRPTRPADTTGAATGRRPAPLARCSGGTPLMARAHRQQQHADVRADQVGEQLPGLGGARGRGPVRYRGPRRLRPRRFCS